MSFDYKRAQKRESWSPSGRPCRGLRDSNSFPLDRAQKFSPETSATQPCICIIFWDTGLKGKDMNIIIFFYYALYYVLYYVLTMYCTMYCIMYCIMYCTMYCTMNCTMYCIMYCTMYCTMFCTMYCTTVMYCNMYFMYCTIYVTMYCTVLWMYYVLFTLDR